ncbi:unnamed protein product [Peronospora destructor]|uniref:Uncharacterized protein n=1 Tax=Peronospora destructor TaxID=86335 RepID=A0AAV0TH56_9STRA|nr:unnamed protein product [Peronospora destructor]CAI5719521.1 unnamed protein product [Peronospora destructor]
MHMGLIASGSIQVGDPAECQVAPNHMTHVLSFALNKMLGTTVDQRGSLVDESHLYFDLTNKKVTSWRTWRLLRRRHQAVEECVHAGFREGGSQAHPCLCAETLCTLFDRAADCSYMLEDFKSSTGELVGGFLR